jgi:dihydroneopterin aldolase
MTLLLASVRNTREAETALAAGADIIDLKDPERGALGALDAGSIRTIVAAVASRAPVSATIGDLPFLTDVIGPAIRAAADCGVDLVKVGLFGPCTASGLHCLERQAANGVRIVLVVFAEHLEPLPFDALAGAGLHGVMLDTADKTTGSLLDKLPMPVLRQFVAGACAVRLLAGLAGSLRKQQIADLLPLQADYLGFRSALCRDGRRDGELDAERIAGIHALLQGAPRRNVSMDEVAAMPAGGTP